VTSLLQATGNDEVEAFYPIIFANYLSDPEVLGKLIASPGGGGGGGGGDAGGAGGDAAEEEKVEEKVEEEEEMDMAGGMDMFGGEEAGGSDY
jgi:ribosomal protein L12E/L44/L45/RPP1/RPP2